MISRPALRFHGSKWLIAKWIIAHFPPHQHYIEPFGGGASVLLQKTRSALEVYNDKDEDIVNFFSVLRDQTTDLVRLIELTPWAFAEWQRAQERDPDRVENARRFYVRSWQSIAGGTAQWRTGWRRQKTVTNSNGIVWTTPACLTFMGTSHLYQIANRLRGVQLECGEALDIMKMYDSPQTLFYLDPPYPSCTRGRWYKAAYKYEMSDEQHCELAQFVQKRINGMVAISGYRCDLYDELYADWERNDVLARTQRQSMAVESLWLSPNLVTARRQELPLFSYMEVNYDHPR